LGAFEDIQCLRKTFPEGALPVWRMGVIDELNHDVVSEV
jgi:hypothetical protein